MKTRRKEVGTGAHARTRGERERALAPALPHAHVFIPSRPLGGVTDRIAPFNANMMRWASRMVRRSIFALNVMVLGLSPISFCSLPFVVRPSVHRPCPYFILPRTRRRARRPTRPSAASASARSSDGGREGGNTSYGVKHAARASKHAHQVGAEGGREGGQASRN